MKGIKLIILALIFFSCYSEEKLNVPVNDSAEVPDTELDRYIQEKFTDEYGMAIRYRYVDRYVDPNQRVTPPELENVRPMLDFIEEFWIEPYASVPNGEAFFKDHVPAEIVFLGGLIYNGDGTVTLGTADAGAQITFTNVNDIDPEDESWRALQLQTVYHEFAHIVHQKYKLPTSYESISPTGYTSAGSWFVLSNQEALHRGFVSPYATSNPNEDFAETVAFYLFDDDFDGHFIDKEDDCQTADCEASNQGKVLIEQKISIIIDHYKRVTGVDLEQVRAQVQSLL